MSQSLDKLTIKGFKSIQSLEKFELTNLNVLIGGNGAGKSNFIDFFRLLRAMMELPLPGLSSASLQAFIVDGGDSDDFLFNGPKITEQIEVETRFGSNGYRFKLAPTADATFIINDEARFYEGGATGWWELGSGHTTPELLKDKERRGVIGRRNVASHVYDAISSWKIYHFHDTSKVAPMRRYEAVDDCDYLRFDAANIAPFLLDLQNHKRTTSTYGQIVDTIRLVAPFFDDFILKPNKNEKVRLRWRQKGSDYPLKPQHLSDGTLRFICLATALLQPDPPSTIIIDEPELGLHPYAIEILAELIKSASKKTQLIISTQSPALVDYFEPEDIIVVNRKNGASVFKRPSKDELSSWLDDYSLGDLWRKNIVTGGPDHE
ncbi:MAG: recombinase RecF [Desulfuromonadales bacterium GWD2_61_12]|nr:MAG: recombinase RecF [Desulfuromonadales bacterium GWC2_61_20]OGR35901.1 MAG: recombinase RecF [Desulfuromonadales bacterium GWD2_61_12]HAD05236.1 recombinase RecF [Desulfuromonas sp.]HBT83699.1 recombinase RecF [Desulfuromonas sp.]